MSISIFHVDAFTERPFAGNPAAVCILPGPRDDAWLQAVAGEMNLSETAFLTTDADGFGLRWFTPKIEVAPHAVMQPLASAHVLWQEGLARPDETIRFQTQSGVLTAKQKGVEIELDFPLEPDEPIEPPASLAKALGVPLKYVSKNRFDFLVEVDSAATVRDMTPDFKLLATVTDRGVIVTAKSDWPYDFVSRFFAPAAGIDEDPVTGSAHCCLGAYWRKQLGKSEFLAFQASARGGVVRVRVGEQRAYLGGKAVTVLKGELLA